ncbi:MAG: hypothetical protein IJ080_08615, partial [Oscillospiraceae bacterium]|nr:hypothetical protein [Oscillospiraceae bacterium]
MNDVYLQKAINVFALILAVLVILEVGHQVDVEVKEQYKTEDAVKFSSADTVSFRGVYIRDEQVIRKNYSGVLSYPVTDGGKVANGSVVADVYNSESEIELNRRIEDLEHELSLLRSAQNPGTIQTADPAFISGLIGEQYQSITSLLAKDEITDIKAQRDSLFTLMCIYQMTIGQESGYDEKIAAVSAEIADLRVERKTAKDEVLSPGSGYFVSYTDGYEDELTFDKVDRLTAERVDEIISDEDGDNAPEKNVVGKLISGYDWKIAGVVDNSLSVFNPGDTVKLSFASVSDTINATIEKLDPTDDPTRSLIVLRCDETTDNLVKIRKDRVDMTLHDFEGVRIPKDALRFNKDNEKGCYILIGQNVKFRKIDEIYREDDYVLSRLTSDPA